MGLVRYLPVLVQLGLLVYCLIDVIQTPDGATRNLSKGWWIVLVLLFPIIGGVAWLVAGRPERQRRSSVAWPAGPTAGFPEYERPDRARGPDDDGEFLASIREVDAEQARTMQAWEDDLRRREERLRREADPAHRPPDTDRPEQRDDPPDGARS